jgi:hypothetical protein
MPRPAGIYHNNLIAQKYPMSMPFPVLSFKAIKSMLVRAGLSTFYNVHDIL